MTRTRFPRAAAFFLGSFALGAVCVGDVPDGPPRDQPDPKPSKLPATKPAGDHDHGNLLVDATTKPTTKPSTKPSAKVSIEGQALLDKVSAAYKSATSLRLAGTITSDLDFNGQQKKDAGEFESLFSAPASGPLKFRHTAKENKQDAQREDTVVGSTGEKLYVFDPNRKYYVSEDAPKGRVGVAALGKQYREVLEGQDPSLLMALADEPLASLLDGVDTAARVDDVTEGGVTFPAVKLISKKGEEAVVLVDPNTHLLRRLTFDLRKPLEKSGQQDVKKALVTIDYTKATTDAGDALKDEAFAWAPPAGARDVGSMTATAAGPGGGGDTSPAMSLEGKPAAEFKLDGLDGKPVSMADLKDSVVVLDFWATWCGPCRAALPGLQKVYEARKADGVHVFAVNLREDADDVKAFVKKTSLTIPVLMDTDGKVGEKYLVQGIPQTVVIGKDGTVKKVFIGAGPDTHDQIQKAVDEANK